MGSSHVTARVWRLGGMLFLICLAIRPCSMSYPRELWAKKPGSNSKLFAIEINAKVGFINNTGKVVIAPTIDVRIEDMGDFFNGLARVHDRGFIDETGKWVIKQEYGWLNDFSDGLARAVVDDPNKEYAHLTLILDPTGKVLAKIRSSPIREFSDGLAAFEAKGKPGIRKLEPGNFVYLDFPGLEGFLDRTGTIVIKPQFAKAGPFIGGLAMAAVDSYCHLATPGGGRQGSPTSGYPSSCGGAPADAVSPCKVGFINSTGYFSIEPRFEAARDFQEKLAAVRIDSLWGFINAQGITVIPPIYEEAQSFREGLAAVRVKGKWGFIDTVGVMIIPPRFEEVEPFSDSLAIATGKKRIVYINRKGNIQIAGPFLEATPFVHGLAAVRFTSDRVTYINHSGKSVFEYTRRKQ